MTTISVKTLVDRLQNKLGRTKERRGEIIFEVCPKCGNDRFNCQFNFAMGVWHCWACGGGGRIDKVIKTLGVIGVEVEGAPEPEEVERSYVDLNSWVPVAMFGKKFEEWEFFHYFMEKALGVEDLVRWQARVKEDKILFPFFVGAELKYYVVRNMTEGSWYQPRGWNKAGTPWYKVSGIGKEIILVEGVPDAMRVERLGYNVLVLTGTEVYPADVQFIRRGGMEPILCLDSDVKDDKLDKIVSKLGMLRVVDVSPYDDPSDVPEKELKEKIIDARMYSLAMKLRKRWQR